MNTKIAKINKSFYPTFNESTTMVELIDDMLQPYINTGRYNTVRSYRTDLLCFFNFANIKTPYDLINLDLKEIKNKILTFLNSGNKLDENGGIMNKASYNKKLYTISKFFNYIRDNYRYPTNPTTSILPFKSKNKAKTNPVNERDLLNILHHLKNKYENPTRSYSKKISSLQNYLIVLFLCFSLRRTEITKLRWDAIRNESEGKFIKVEQKGGTDKYIPINHIWELLQKLKKTKEKKGYISNYIFSPIKRGDYAISKPINNNYVYSLIQRIAKQLNINGITPHSFRVSFVTKAMNQGININNIMNATGHHSVELVRYYDKSSQVNNNAINNIASDLFEQL